LNTSAHPSNNIGQIRAIIIDDEPLAHDVIKHHLIQHPDVTVQKDCYNATEALMWLAQNTVDLLFLDINMPQLNGIDMLKVLAHKPQVVIVSAYQEYAVQGFDLDVADYLVKPVSAQRLEMALEKVRKRLALQQTDTSSNPLEQLHIIVKVDREKRKFLLAEISLFEAYGNYVKLWSQGKMVLVNSTLKSIITQLPGEQFAQVNKSYVVNKQHVAAVGVSSLKLSCGKEIKVGNTYRKVAQSLI
jgi:two-component system, LytTR family, response regulator